MEEFKNKMFAGMGIKEDGEKIYSRNCETGEYERNLEAEKRSAEWYKWCEENIKISSFEWK